MTRENIFLILKKELPYLKEKYGVNRIALFGSFAQNQQTEKSDVDLVVEFEKPIGLDFIDLAEYLEKVIGKKIDLLTPDGISSIRIPRVSESIKRNLIYV